MDRLIDRMLIRQQMIGGYTPPAQQVERRMVQVRAAFPRGKVRRGLARHTGCLWSDEQQLRKSVEEQLQLMQFVDARLRHMASVSREEVEAYYQQKLLPELSRKAAPPEPLDNVRSEIYELLLQQKIDAQLNSWLAGLREQAEVRIPHPVTAGGGASPGTSFSAVVGR